jgi:ABC-type nitrate/sulfonate/bicarbonate transport system, permease component
MNSKVSVNNVSRGTQKNKAAVYCLGYFLVLLVLVWQAASSSGLLQSRVLPAPSAVVSAFWHLLLSGELWQHVKVSAGRALLGLLIGGGLGTDFRATQRLIAYCFNLG